MKTVPVNAQMVNFLLSVNGNGPTELYCTRCMGSVFKLFFDPLKLKIICACERCECPVEEIDVDCELKK